jgi:amino acid permease
MEGVNLHKPNSFSIVYESSAYMRSSARSIQSNVSIDMETDGAIKQVMSRRGSQISDSRTCGVTEAHEDDFRTILAAVANCTNTVLGAGTLAVPAAMSLSGLVVYEVLVVLIFTATLISLKWLIAVADVTPIDTACNYESISAQYLPPAMTTAIVCAFTVSMFALCMSYMLFISSSLAPIFHEFGLGDEDTLQNPIMFAVGGFIILPLSLLRDVSKLKTTSYFGIVTILYSSGYVFWSSYGFLQRYGINASFKPFNFSRGIWVCIAMTTSAFSCHVSAMPIYRSLGDGRSPRTMMTVVVISLGLSAVVYHSVGISAYLRFGAVVEANVLKSVADSEDLSMCLALANIGVPASLMTSMPLAMWPLRSCTIRAYRLAVGKNLIRDASNSEWRNSTTLLMLAILGAAVLVPSITKVMGLGGAIGTAFIVFIYPSAFHLSVVKQTRVSDWMQRKNWQELVMMAIGTILGIICFSVAFSSMIQEMYSHFASPPLNSTDANASLNSTDANASF